MPENKIKNMVGYTRISSESQKDNTSIKEQIKRIQAYCTSQGYNLVKIFKDEAKSASTIDNREEYNKMLEYVKTENNGIDGIIVYKSDRIHRHLKNLLIMIEDELNTKEVAFISVSENFDTSMPQGMLTLQMLGSFAEFERNLINERTRTGRIITASAGKYAGGKIPYGYALENGKLIVNEEEAQTVAQIFKLYASGMSYEEVANQLNQSESQINDKAQVANQDLKNHKKRWSRTSICYILRNLTYTGTYFYNGKKEKNGVQVKMAIPVLIHKNLFNKAQEMRKKKGHKI